MADSVNPDKQTASEESPNYSSQSDATVDEQAVDNDSSNATINDTATEVDSLGFEPYVAAIATFLTDAATKPPLTLSIEGEWGSGKSSFMKQLQRKIEVSVQGRAKPKIVWFNAWRHDQHEELWAAFALTFLNTISQTSNPIAFIGKRLALIRRRMNWDKIPNLIYFLGKLLFLFGLIGAILVAFYIGGGWDNVSKFGISDKQCSSSPTERQLEAGNPSPNASPPLQPSTQTDADGDQTNPTESQPEAGNPSPNQSSPLQPGAPTDSDECQTESNFLLKLMILLGGGGGAITGLFALIFKVDELIASPTSDLKKYLKFPDYENRVAFIEQFHQDFDKIVDVYAGKDKTNTPNKIYVFIDDIDRCELTKAAELMQAVYLMTADNPHIIFILGMDREKLAASIALRQKAILPYLPSSSGNGNGDVAKSQERLQGLDYGYTFIEKFIQLPFQTPRPSSDPKKLDNFFDKLFDNKQKPGRVKELLSKRLGAKNDREITQAGNENLSDQNKFRSHLNEPLTLTRLKEIVKIVAPALDHNPRRLKLFINLLRLKGYLTWNTGFTQRNSEEERVLLVLCKLYFKIQNDRPSKCEVLDLDFLFIYIFSLAYHLIYRRVHTLTLEQLGKFTAISLKWPLLLADLGREKTLLADLQRFAIDGAAAKTEKVSDKIPESLSCSVENWKSEQTLIDLLRVGCCKGDPDPDRYSLEKVNIRKLLEVSPPLVRDDLSSEKGIDYRKLQRLLQEENWVAADIETYEVMIRAMGKRSGDWFSHNELLNFPCTDLRTIDRLWVKYSNKIFGFSVQKEIYDQCSKSYETTASRGLRFKVLERHKIWKKFGDEVGWRKADRWINYPGSVAFDHTTAEEWKKGHLPALWLFIDEIRHLRFTNLSFVVMAVETTWEFSSLASRLEKCNP